MSRAIARAVSRTNTDFFASGLRSYRNLKFQTCRIVWDKRCYCQTAEGQDGDSRSVNLTKVRSGGTFYMDTLELAKILKVEGFTEQQSEVLTRILVDVVTAALDHQARTMVTKPQQEIMVQQLMSQINSVKKDMVILEKSEFTMIKSDTDKLQIVIKNLENKFEDEIKKLKGQVLLDINLERGRATEARVKSIVRKGENACVAFNPPPHCLDFFMTMKVKAFQNIVEKEKMQHSINEKKVTTLEYKMEVEHANNATALKELEKKIDVGVSKSQTDHEKFKSQFYSGIVASIVTVMGLALGWYRLFLTKPEKPPPLPPQVEVKSTHSGS